MRPHPTRYALLGAALLLFSTPSLAAADDVVPAETKPPTVVEHPLDREVRELREAAKTLLVRLETRAAAASDEAAIRAIQREITAVKLGEERGRLEIQLRFARTHGTAPHVETLERALSRMDDAALPVRPLSRAEITAAVASN